MLKKVLLLLIIISMAWNLGKYFVPDHHNNTHHHSHTQKLSSHQLILHYLEEHINFNKEHVILGTALLVLLFFKSFGFHLLLLWNKIVVLCIKITPHHTCFIKLPPPCVYAPCFFTHLLIILLI
ncbi:MAG: Unknown protein [uncultured Sulfurovum sp.]|uniref:Uncharacterized protein n=1 Tax=uncultured Sulfurovum sp. TaxID=269237 RepID=A0A6S6U3J8_9BACT|nr:MAG: Unknown protein [uncultured Sulfurovum sp.]